MCNLHTRHMAWAVLSSTATGSGIQRCKISTASLVFNLRHLTAHLTLEGHAAPLSGFLNMDQCDVHLFIFRNSVLFGFSDPETCICIGPILALCMTIGIHE